MNQRIDIATKEGMLAERFYEYDNNFYRHRQGSPKMGVTDVLSADGHWTPYEGNSLKPVFFGDQIDESDLEGVAREEPEPTQHEAD